MPGTLHALFPTNLFNTYRVLSESEKAYHIQGLGAFMVDSARHYHQLNELLETAKETDFETAIVPEIAENLEHYLEEDISLINDYIEVLGGLPARYIDPDEQLPRQGVFYGCRGLDVHAERWDLDFEGMLWVEDAPGYGQANVILPANFLLEALDGHEDIAA